MSNKIPRAFISLLVLGAVTFQPAAAVGPRQNVKIKTELWTGGDDVLTLKFSAALRKAIASSKDFELSNDVSNHNSYDDSKQYLLANGAKEDKFSSGRGVHARRKISRDHHITMLGR